MKKGFFKETGFGPGPDPEGPLPGQLPGVRAGRGGIDCCAAASAELCRRGYRCPAAPAELSCRGSSRGRCRCGSRRLCRNHRRSADPAELLVPGYRAAAGRADIPARGGGRCSCRGRRGSNGGGSGHVRDLHQALAAELVARLDRVAAGSAHQPSGRGCCRRCRGGWCRCRWRDLCRWGRGCLVTGGGGGQCCSGHVRDLHQALAAELVARLDRVAAGFAHKSAGQGWRGCRCCGNRRLRGRRLVHRLRGGRGLVYRRRGGSGGRRDRCTPGPRPADPAELLVGSQRCAAGPAGQRCRRDRRCLGCCGRRFFEERGTAGPAELLRGAYAFATFGTERHGSIT